MAAFGSFGLLHLSMREARSVDLVHLTRNFGNMPKSIQKLQTVAPVLFYARKNLPLKLHRRLSVLIDDTVTGFCHFITEAQILFYV